MVLILWLAAVVLVSSGVRAMMNKKFVNGAVLIAVGLLVGPGGISIFT